MAAAAFIMAAMPGSAIGGSSDSGKIVVAVTIEPFIVLSGDDTQLAWQSDGLSEIHNNTLLSTNPEARARFTVRANRPYFLTVTVPNTWQASAVLSGSRASDRLVRFDGATTGDFIGGLLFLDEDVSTTQSGSNGTTMWDAKAGKLITGHYGAETREWGLGAVFNPELVGNSDNPNGASGVVVQPDTYSTRAMITAAIVP